MGSCSFCASQEDQLYYCNRRSTILLEGQLYHWKTNCCVGRSTVLLENRLYYWKINCDAGRSMVLLEDQLYWRQSTGLDGNYRSRKITARWWLHKYVGAECGASSFTWYLYQICNTDVRLSVCLSVRHTFLTMFQSSYHHEIFRSYYQWQKWRPCKRSKVKVTEVTTQLNGFRTVTPVWIHIWWWNDAYSLMLLRRGALLFFKVIRQISRSHGSKNRRIWPRLGVSGL